MDISHELLSLYYVLQDESRAGNSVTLNSKEITMILGYIDTLEKEYSSLLSEVRNVHNDNDI